MRILSDLRGVTARALVIALVVLLAASVAATSSASPERAGQSQVAVAFLLATTSAGYPKGMLVAAKEAAMRNNVKLTVFDAQFDPQKQFAQCQDAIARGTFDAIVTLPAASAAMTPCARLAKKANIPLISTDTPIGTNLAVGRPTVPGVTAQVLVPAITAFRSLGPFVGAACKRMGGGKNCRVGFIMGVKALALTGPARDMIGTWTKDMTFVGEGEGFYQRGGGLKITQDLLQKDRGLNIIVSMSDDMALGAEIALKSAGKVPGRDVLILTQGGSYQGVKNLRAGRWFATSVANAETEGRIPIELAARAARGQKVPSYVNSTKAGGTPQIITKERLKKLPWFKGTFPA